MLSFKSHLNDESVSSLELDTSLHSYKITRIARLNAAVFYGVFISCLDKSALL